MKNKLFFIMLFVTFVSMTFVSGAFVVENCEAECFGMTDNNAVNDCLTECDELYYASLEEFVEEVEPEVIDDSIQVSVVVGDGLSLTGSVIEENLGVEETDEEETVGTGEVVEETSHSDTEEVVGCTSTESGKDCSIEGYPKFTVEGDVTVTEKDGEVVVSAIGEEATLILKDGSKVVIPVESPLTLEKEVEKKGFVAKLKSIWSGFWGKLFGNKISSDGKANTVVRG